MIVVDETRQKRLKINYDTVIPYDLYGNKIHVILYLAKIIAYKQPCHELSFIISDAIFTSVIILWCRKKIFAKSYNF